MELGLYHGCERGQRLPVEVIDGRGEHENRKHEPTIRRQGWKPVRFGFTHWNSMVATSPAVARRALDLGKYSMTTRRDFCGPQPSASSPPPVITILAGSATSSLTSFLSSPWTTR